MKRILSFHFFLEECRVPGRFKFWTWRYSEWLKDIIFSVPKQLKILIRFPFWMVYIPCTLISFPKGKSDKTSYPLYMQLPARKSSTLPSPSHVELVVPNWKRFFLEPFPSPPASSKVIYIWTIKCEAAFLSNAYISDNTRNAALTNTVHI